MNPEEFKKDPASPHKLPHEMARSILEMQLKGKKLREILQAQSPLQSLPEGENPVQATARLRSENSDRLAANILSTLEKIGAGQKLDDLEMNVFPQANQFFQNILAHVEYLKNQDTGNGQYSYLEMHEKDIKELQDIIAAMDKLAAALGIERQR